ncbi:MAG: hypothetical protein ACRERV_18055 [Methylococcales bacterium]
MVIVQVCGVFCSKTAENPIKPGMGSRHREVKDRQLRSQNMHQHVNWQAEENIVMTVKP